MNAVRSIAVLIGFCLCLGAPALAQSQVSERLGDHQSWSAFKSKEGDKNFCFMAAQPMKDVGDYEKRGEIYAMVAHWPAEQRIDEVSFIMGYTLKPESEVVVDIDGKTHKLFIEKDGAYPYSKEESRALVKSMIAGREMVVKGTSWRGTQTTDTYSLSGFTAAYQETRTACKVK